MMHSIELDNGVKVSVSRDDETEKPRIYIEDGTTKDDGFIAFYSDEFEHIKKAADVLVAQFED